MPANDRRHRGKSKSQERKYAECERPQRKSGQIIMGGFERYRGC